jgi:S-adenosylmethionine-dependent methyltransferase
MNAIKAENRFENEATRYAEYLETPDGRLRTDLTFVSLQELLPADPHSLCALDLGCGTGAAAVRLARLGVHVTLMDASSSMLELARQTFIKIGLTDKMTLKLGDVSDLPKIVRLRSFDVILCHNVLEFVEDAVTVLRNISQTMRNSSSILSLLVRSQAGEVLKAALQAGDLAAAEHNLTAEWGTESLYGGKVRFFSPELVEVMFKDASLTVIDRRAVRVVSDYLPPKISRSAEYDRVFALERKLSMRPEFFGMARYLHYLVRSEEGAPMATEKH